MLGKPRELNPDMPVKSWWGIQGFCHLLFNKLVLFNSYLSSFVGWQWHPCIHPLKWRPHSHNKRIACARAQKHPETTLSLNRSSRHLISASEKLYSGSPESSGPRPLSEVGSSHVKKPARWMTQVKTSYRYCHRCFTKLGQQVSNILPMLFLRASPSTFGLS